eukprot:scaffold26109_cov66-Phaeocystis_antarctica.AAC.4
MQRATQAIELLGRPSGSGTMQAEEPRHQNGSAGAASTPRNVRPRQGRIYVNHAGPGHRAPELLAVPSWPAVVSRLLDCEAHSLA